MGTLLRWGTLYTVFAMIRILRYTFTESYCECDFPEVIHLCVAPSLTQDAGIEGDEYYAGFIPAQIVGYVDSCGAAPSRTVSIQYDDQYLISYDAELGRATVPLGVCDIQGVIKESCFLNFVRAIIAAETA